MSPSNIPEAGIDVDPSSMPADLAQVATRARLTPAAIDGVIRIAEIWHLTNSEICQLLGNVSERTWFRIKKSGSARALSQDTLTRISLLVGLFKGLRLLFTAPLADDWVRLPNTGARFGGRRPLDLMCEGGIPAMLAVRRHIDALRGGL